MGKEFLRKKMEPTKAMVKILSVLLDQHCFSSVSRPPVPESREANGLYTPEREGCCGGGIMTLRLRSMYKRGEIRAHRILWLYSGSSKKTHVVDNNDHT